MEFPNFGTSHESQRGYFSAQLYEEMLKNKDIWLLFGDLGYGMFNKHRETFPDRAINTGAAEMGMMGAAVGLALEGKIPVVYSITSFLLRRPFEILKFYVNDEQIPVKLVGSGRNKDYAHDGPSHFSEDDVEIMRLFSNIIPHWPKDKEQVPKMVHKMLNNPSPTYLNLTR